MESFKIAGVGKAGQKWARNGTWYSSWDLSLEALDSG